MKKISFLFIFTIFLAEIIPMENKRNSESISITEALQDLEQFYYTLKKGSIAYYLSNEQEKKEIESRYNNYKEILLRNKAVSSNILDEEKQINTFDFYTELTKIMGKVLKDKHSSLIYEENEDIIRYKFAEDFIPYFSSDYYLKKNNYFVEQSNKIIKNTYKLLCECKNEEIRQNTPYMIPIIHNNKELYKIVFFSDTNDKNICYTDDSKKYVFYRSDFDYSKWNVYNSIYNNAESAYWCCPYFYFEPAVKENLFNAFSKSAKSSVNKNIIFIDNRTNQGGSPFYHIQLLFELFGLDLNIFTDYIANLDYSKNPIEGSALLSKLVAEQNIRVYENQKKYTETETEDIKYWRNVYQTYSNDKVDFLLENANIPWLHNKEITNSIKFKGLIVFIIDYESVSWGELFYDYIKSGFNYKNIILVGTNSNGSATYGNPFVYTLKNSGIKMRLSSRTDDSVNDSNYYRQNIEGKGFFPDYWVSTEAELAELIDYLYKQNVK